MCLLTFGQEGLAIAESTAFFLLLFILMCDPTHIVSSTEQRQFASFVDCYSQTTLVYLINTKGKVTAYFSTVS